MTGRDGREGGGCLTGPAPAADTAPAGAFEALAAIHAAEDERTLAAAVAHARSLLSGGDPANLGAVFDAQGRLALARLRGVAALEEARERLDDFSRIASDWMWEQDAQLRFCFISPRREELLGTSNADLIGRQRREISIAQPDDPAWVAHEQTLAARLPFRDFVVQVPDAAGGQRYLALSGRPRFDGETFLGYRGVATDVTARVADIQALEQKNRALEAAQALNHQFLEHSPDLIVACDRAGMIRMIGPRVRDLLGYDPAMLIGTPVVGLVHPDHRRRAGMLAARMRRDGRPRDLEVLCRRADGTSLPVHWAGLWSDQAEAYFFVGRDVGDRRAAELRARHAQRLEALGRLTGGIAHDFNNLLLVILANAETLAERLSDDAVGLRLVEMTRDAAQRGADLVERLLAFAQRRSLAPRLVDVGDLIRAGVNLLRRVAGDQAELVLMVPDIEAQCRIDAGQFDLALLNLVINARDAAGRRIIIRLARPDDSWIEVSVTDNGTGMNAEVQARVFEPFFTTKEVGHGTGLGLSMVHGFVAQSGGTIRVDSRAGHGSTLTMRLPSSRG